MKVAVRSEERAAPVTSWEGPLKGLSASASAERVTVSHPNNVEVNPTFAVSLNLRAMQLNQHRRESSVFC